MIKQLDATLSFEKPNHKADCTLQRAIALSRAKEGKAILLHKLTRSTRPWYFDHCSSSNAVGHTVRILSGIIPAGGEVGLLLPVLLAEGAAGAVDADAARADGRAPRLGLRTMM